MRPATLKLLRTFAFTVAVCLTAAGSLRADLMTFDNNGALNEFIDINPPLTRENVVFNGSGTNTGPGLELTGRTNSTDLLLDVSSSESIENQGIGQANIEAIVGTYNDLTIGPLNPLGTFTVAAFSFDPDNSQSFPTTTTIIVTEADDTTTPFIIDVAGGQNIFFGIVAFNGQSIKKIEINSEADLDRVRQVDIGFGTVIINPVPEPASITVWGVLGSASLAGLVWYRRRRFPVAARIR